MFANANGIDAHLIGENCLVEQVAHDLRVMHRLAIKAHGNIAKGVEAKFSLFGHV